jgi:uncharacterized protein
VRALAETDLGARYLTLDEPTVRAAAEGDPAAFVADLEGPVVLDAVQQAPSLFPVLRRAVDRDRTPGRLLLTGSAQILVVPRLAEVLVGRMEVLRLWPLSQGEIDDVREGFADAVFRDDLPALSGRSGTRASLVQRALRGGYPEAVGRTGARRAAWFRSYVELLLQRDVRDLAEIERLNALPRLLELLAARSGSLSNLAELSRSAGIPQSTLKRYFALLQGVFLVTSIPAWASNPSKRLVRSPRVYLTDTGILAYLLRIGSDSLRERPQGAGPLIETFVAMELQKQIGWSEASLRLHHFRTAAGREVDFVLEDDRGRLVGIEVKSAAAVARADFQGLETLAEVAGRSFHRGLVLYTGEERVSFGPRLHALPVDALWRLGAGKVRDRLPR